MRVILTPALAIAYASLVACSGGGASADGAPVDGAPAADGSPPVSYEYFSVVSEDGFLAVPPPACPGGEWIDYGCDAVIPLDCAAHGERIASNDSDPSDPCPVCIAPQETDPSTCEGWQAAYGDFLARLVSGSCANFCGGEFPCGGLVITNACGTYALALTPAIDEEPTIFAEEFAVENCSQHCSPVEQTVTGLDPLFPEYEAMCHEHQCLLARRLELPSSPDASPR